MVNRIVLILLAAVLGVGAIVCGRTSVCRADDAPETSAKHVRELVEQLGDDAFSEREAAQRALIALGERIVPNLDKITAPTDPEVRYRLETVRYELIGFKRDITSHLERMEQIRSPKELATRLAGLIMRYQPRSSDHLLAMIEQRNHELHSRATNAFVQTWGAATVDQIKRYVQANLRLEAKNRSRYPQGVLAWVGMQYTFAHGSAGWPGTRTAA